MRRILFGVLTLGAFAVISLMSADSLGAGEKGKKKVELKVKVGDDAPAFESVDENGKAVKSTDVVGKKIVVLFFYPADFTGGWTAQACGFRDEIEKLAGKDVAVFGVSGDSVKTHKLFRDHHKLGYPLLSDEKGELAGKFGIPVGKGGMVKFNDKEANKVHELVRGVTIGRFTIVIDKAGKVAAADQVTGAGGDAKRVTEVVKKLATN